jgi:hypothetical protein
MPSHSVALWVNLGCSLYLTGLICFVQLVHYPLFAQVGREQFRAYAAAHSRRTVWVTAPLMILELLSSAYLLALPEAGSSLVLLRIAGGLTALLWLSTFLVQVPLHNVLAQGFDEQAWRRLVWSNWFRTFAWCLRSALLIYLITRRGHE